MKDPLDPRPDLYGRINAEAERQRKRDRVSRQTKAMPMRKVCGDLRRQAEDKAAWTELYDLATKPDRRAWEDLLLYDVESHGAAAVALPEPSLGHEPLPLPDIDPVAACLTIAADQLAAALPPLHDRDMPISSSTRYDTVANPVITIEFDR